MKCKRCIHKLRKKNIKMRSLILILTITLTSCNVKTKEEVKLTETINTSAPKIEFNLIDTVLKNLNLKKENCKMDWVALKKMPNNPEETIVVVPEIVAENEVEHYIELNSYIVIANSETGKIINNYFESSKTNRWVSDSVELIGISIDTAPYNVTDDTRAFGIRARFVGRSIANPLENEIISLFIKSDNTLKKILKNYDVMNYGGERVTNCEGEFIRENKTFIITDNKAVTNYYDILVKSKITETISYEEENGGCQSEIDITTKETVLEYDGNEYKAVVKSTKKNNTTTAKIKLIDTVLKNLKIKKEKCKTDLVVLKEIPNNPEEIILVIPEIVDEGEQYFELNSYILIVNKETGKITHKYFESSKTNQWVSDAITMSEITIDTAPYNITDHKRAFGINVRYVGSSHANPYEKETISLFVKSENELKNILKNFVLLVDRGEWDTDCAGEFTNLKNTLFLSKEKTNNYFDILVESKITETIAYKDKNGNCDSKEKSTTKKIILKFDGKVYNDTAKN